MELRHLRRAPVAHLATLAKPAGKCGELLQGLQCVTAFCQSTASRPSSIATDWMRGLALHWGSIVFNDGGYREIVVSRLKAFALVFS
jgi:hypothetical protein